MRIAVLLLAGCSRWSWAPELRHRTPTPDPAGPCLQITHVGNHLWDLYKGEHRVGRHAPASYALAYDDHPASAELIAESERYNDRAEIVGVGGVLTGLATFGVGMGLSSPVTAGVGAGLSVTSFAAVGLLLALADARWHDSVDEYNTWAAAHGCPRDVPVADASSSP